MLLIMGLFKGKPKVDHDFGAGASQAVPTTSGLRTCAEVDKAGVRIAACDGAAYARTSATDTECKKKEATNPNGSLKSRFCGWSAI